MLPPPSPSARSVRLLKLSRLSQRADQLPASAPVALFPLPGRDALVVSRAGDLWRWAWTADAPFAPLHLRAPSDDPRGRSKSVVNADHLVP